MMNDDAQPTVTPSLSDYQREVLADKHWTDAEVQQTLAMLDDEIAMRMFCIFGSLDRHRLHKGAWCARVDGSEYALPMTLKGLALQGEFLGDAIMLSARVVPATEGRLRVLLRRVAPAILDLVGAAGGNPWACMARVLGRLKMNGLMELKVRRPGHPECAWYLTEAGRVRVETQVWPAWQARAVAQAN